MTQDTTAPNHETPEVVTTEAADAEHVVETGRPKKKSVAIFLGGVQVVFILLYGFLVEHGDNSTATAGAEEEHDESLTRLYPFYQDVHVMVLVGFGFLMTFLHRYSMSSVAFNLLISAYMIQWAILTNGFWHRAFRIHVSFHEKIQVGVGDLIAADFGAAAVLISFGAVLGKAGPAQLLFMGLCEIFLYSLNEAIGVGEYGAVDMGGSLYVHSFGAFFGVAASFAFMSFSEVERRKGTAEASSRTSDTFAMIGTLFLWMFWPSFNGALAMGSARNRVVVNTVLAISASCTSAFVASYVLRKSGKFSMVDIQNATLAGGVAVGSSSDLVINSWPAMLIGFLAGAISVSGYVFLQPALAKMGLHDTCGVLNLHGLPGIMGGVSGAISAATSGSSVYGSDIGLVFPARSGGARTASYQAWMQTACVFTTVGISVAGGLVVGFLMRYVPDPAAEGDQRLFEDGKYWEMEEPDSEEPIEQSVVVEKAVEHQPF